MSSAAVSTPSIDTRRSSISISALSWETSWKRYSDTSRCAPSTYSVSSAVSASSVKTGASSLDERALAGGQRRVGEL